MQIYLICFGFPGLLVRNLGRAEAARSASELGSAAHAFCSDCWLELPHGEQKVSDSNRISGHTSYTLYKQLFNFIIYFIIFLPAHAPKRLRKSPMNDSLLNKWSLPAFSTKYRYFSAFFDAYKAPIRAKPSRMLANAPKTSVNKNSNRSTAAIAVTFIGFQN